MIICQSCKFNDGQLIEWSPKNPLKKIGKKKNDK